jgi:WD40 repeat protein
MRFFKGQKPPYRGVAYRPDGRTLITATQSGVVTLWDLDAGRELTRLKGKPGPPYRMSDIEAMALSPDGRLLAAAGPTLRVWNLDSGALVEGFDAGEVPAFRGVTFALNGLRLVASINGGFSLAFGRAGLAQWVTADGSDLPVLPADSYARSLTASPDGESVFTESAARTVRWHLPTRQQYPTAFSVSSCSSLASSPAAGVVAHGIYRTVEIRDANGERLLAQWEAHKKGVFALVFSADGTLLATGSGDEVVKVWDVSGVPSVLADPNAPPLTSMPERSAFEWGLGPVRALAFSPDGLTAAAVGDRVKFVVWDVE